VGVIFHKQRVEKRTRIAMKAQLRVGSYVWDVTLTNASSRGVLAVLASPPARGTKVEVVLGGHTLAGQVRWHGVDCCGIALRDPISVADLLEGNAVPITLVEEPRMTRGVGGLLRSLMPLG